jgi:hypothetical protein
VEARGLLRAARQVAGVSHPFPPHTNRMHGTATMRTPSRACRPPWSWGGGRC